MVVTNKYIYQVALYSQVDLNLANQDSKIQRPCKAETIDFFLLCIKNINKPCIQAHS